MPGRLLPADRVLGIPDLGLAREEHQHVARRLPGELVEGVVDALEVVAVGADRAGHVVVLVGLHGIRHQRPVPDVDRVGASAHLDDRRGRAVGRGEVPREALRIDRRARDDEFQLGAPGEQLLQVAEQEVDREAAFVGLVEDDRVVLAQLAVAIELGEQHAVGHQLDPGVGLRPVVEAHLVADDPAELDAELVGDPLGDAARRDPPRLRVSDALASQLEADLRKLRGLARPRLAGHDHDLVVADDARDLLPALADGQLGRVVDDEGRRRRGLGHEPFILWSAGRARGKVQG